MLFMLFVLFMLFILFMLYLYLYLYLYWCDPGLVESRQHGAHLPRRVSTAELTLPSGHARSNAAMAPGAAHTVALRPLQPAALLCCSLCGSTLPSGSCGGDPNA